MRLRLIYKLLVWLWSFVVIANSLRILWSNTCTVSNYAYSDFTMDANSNISVCLWIYMDQLRTDGQAGTLYSIGLSDNSGWFMLRGGQAKWIFLSKARNSWIYYNQNITLMGGWTYHCFIRQQPNHVRWYMKKVAEEELTMLVDITLNPNEGQSNSYRVLFFNQMNGFDVNSFERDKCFSGAIANANIWNTAVDVYNLTHVSIGNQFSLETANVTMGGDVVDGSENGEFMRDWTLKSPSYWEWKKLANIALQLPAKAMSEFRTQNRLRCLDTCCGQHNCYLVQIIRDGDQHLLCKLYDFTVATFVYQNSISDMTSNLYIYIQP